MLEKLPIQLPQFAPEQWRSLEEQLIAIANREKLELEPRDRIVHKALPMVQHAAKSKQWTYVFDFLEERGVIEIKVETTEKMKALTPRIKTPKATPRPKIYRQSLKERFKVALPEILYSDRALGIKTIKDKAEKLGIRFSDRTCREYLSQFANCGLIYRAIETPKYAAYALQQTDLIDPNEWMPASIVYRIAVQNGYKNSYQFFKNRPYTSSRELVAKFYSQYGIEYKFDHDCMDNFKWRLIN